MNVFSMIEKHKNQVIGSIDYLSNACSANSSIKSLTEVYLSETETPSSYAQHVKRNLSILIASILKIDQYDIISFDDYCRFVKFYIKGIATWNLVVDENDNVFRAVIFPYEYDKVYPTSNNLQTLILAAEANAAWVLDYEKAVKNKEIDASEYRKYHTVAKLDTSAVDAFYRLGDILKYQLV